MPARLQSSLCRRPTRRAAVLPELLALRWAGLEGGVPVGDPFDPSHKKLKTFGSEREFDERPISRGFSKHDEFGFGNRHTLSLEEQVV